MSRERRRKERGSEVVLAGEPDFRLALVVHGYEFPGDETGDDAEWLVGSLDLRVAGIATARLANDPFLRGIELASFGEQLEELLAGRSSKAELATLEDMVELRLERVDGKAVAEGLVTNHGSARVEFDDVEIELDDLARTREQVAALLLEFPVRG